MSDNSLIKDIVAVLEFIWIYMWGVHTNEVVPQLINEDKDVPTFDIINIQGTRMTHCERSALTAVSDALIFPDFILPYYYIPQIQMS